MDSLVLMCTCEHDHHREGHSYRGRMHGEYSMTKMCQAFLMIPRVLRILHSPVHSNDDVIIIHSFDDNKFTIGRERRLCISLEWWKMTAPTYIPRMSLKVQSHLRQ